MHLTATTKINNLCREEYDVHVVGVDVKNYIDYMLGGVVIFLEEITGDENRNSIM